MSPQPTLRFSPPETPLLPPPRHTLGLAFRKQTHPQIVPLPAPFSPPGRLPAAPSRPVPPAPSVCERNTQPTPSPPLPAGARGGQREETTPSASPPACTPGAACGCAAARWGALPRPTPRAGGTVPPSTRGPAPTAPQLMAFPPPKISRFTACHRGAVPPLAADPRGLALPRPEPRVNGHERDPSPTSAPRAADFPNPPIFGGFLI